MRAGQLQPTSAVAKHRRIYYAHPIPLYGTATERQQVRLIRMNFPGSSILNPSQYQNYPNDRKVMSHYRALVDRCDTLVFSRLSNKITAGVGKEVNHALAQGLPVFEVKRQNLVQIDKPVAYMNVRETKRLLRKFMTPERYALVLGGSIPGLPLRQRNSPQT